MLKYSQQVPVELTDVGVLRLIMDGIAKDVEGREWEVLAVGSAVLVPWFVVELSPSPGGIVALLPAAELFTVGSDSMSVMPAVETFALFSPGAVIASLSSNAITVPARISEMWIMDCCPVIL